MMRIGIVGLGKLGKMRFDMLNQLQGIEVISFYDPNILAYKGVTTAATPDEVFHNKEVSAVIICAPNVYTKTYISTALAAGKDVLCEKPPGITYEEASFMAALQQTHPERVLKFAFNHRYLAHFQELQAITADRRYGNVLWIRGVYGKGYDSNFYKQWRSRREFAGGGILLDQGIHMLDLILQLVEGARVEHAAVDRLKWRESDVEDNVFAQLRSDSGVPISFHSSMVHWPHTFRLEVCFDEALVVIQGVKSSTRSYGDEEVIVHTGWREGFVEVHRRKYNEPDYYTFAREHEEWLNKLIHREAHLQGTVQDAVRVMKAVQDIYAFQPAALVAPVPVEKTAVI